MTAHLPIVPMAPVLHAGETYRGWSISFDYPPIPIRDFDWSANHPDYDCAGDADDSRLVRAPTLEGVKAEIDAWISENTEDLSC
jgi:hypothetical protein